MTTETASLEALVRRLDAQDALLERITFEMLGLSRVVHDLSVALDEAVRQLSGAAPAGDPLAARDARGAST